MHIRNIDLAQLEACLEEWEERLEESIHCITKHPTHQCNWEDNLEAWEAVHLLNHIKAHHMGTEQHTHDPVLPSTPMHPHQGMEQNPGHRHKYQ